MHRSIAIFFALILTTISIATTGLAAEVGSLRFEVSEGGRDRLQLALRRNLSSDRTSSSSFEVKDLAGFDRAALRSAAGAPVRFSLVREPGRFDCSGRAENRRARGACRFTGDTSYASYLTANGIRQPTEDEWIDLTLVGAGRSLVAALREGRYAMPSPGTLAGMTAVGVTPGYIRDMAANGYRLQRTEDLIPLRALDVSPAYIRSLKSVGYDRLPIDQLIQLKALGVTADFIASYQRYGYRDLSVSRLVQLKALGIRPQDLGRKTAARMLLLDAAAPAPTAMSSLLP